MIISRTPFRISFFGGGTDYPAWYLKNGGAVLSTTINKYCYITCRYLPPFFEHKTRIIWSKIESVKDLREIQHPAVPAIFKFMGIREGIEMHHDSDLPARSGLGSSSAFTVGSLNALNAFQGKIITKRQLALDAIYVEQEKIKENVGSQDQTAAAFGGLNKIAFGGPQKISVKPITLTYERWDDFQKHILVVFTGFSRNATEVAAEQIKNVSKNISALRRMGEMVDESIEILHSGKSLDRFGKLLHEGWRLKKSLAHNISNTFIDSIYTAGIKAGASGGKLLGAGGGGFIMFFVKPELQSRVKKTLSKLLHVPIRFENIGSQIIYYGPENHF